MKEMSMNVTRISNGTNTDTPAMAKTFMKKVMDAGTVDTKIYRYRCIENGNGGYTIKRIAKNVLDTTATCSDKSDTNPDGWEIVTVTK